MKNKRLIFGIVALAIPVLIIGLYWIKKPLSEVDQIMNAGKGFNFPAGFPPDPGEAGKKTLEGIDSDHDGLRDDLQRWIYARFPNDPKKRAALKQMAIVFQNGLLMKHDRKEMDKANQRLSKGIQCLHEVFGNQNSEMELVRAKALNTRERTLRHLEVDRWYDGTTLGSHENDGTACEN